MTRSHRVIVVALTAMVLLAAGCTRSGTTWVNPTAAPSTPGASAPVAATVAWKSCADRARSILGRQPPAGMSYDCGTLTVPADWSHPSNGGKLQIALIRIRAAGQHNRIGSLLVNPGGPGASGVELAVYLSAGALPTQVTGQFDIVGFDPRGIGWSTEIKCFTNAELDAEFGADPDPVSTAAFNSVVALNREMDQQCATKYGAELSLFSTEETAKDMDAIRAAVGDKKLTYLGYSYGTLLGATYAQLFPHNVRAMVLDGAVDPLENDVAASQGQAAGFEHAFDNFAAWCRTSSQCPIQPDARAAVTQAINSARTAPVTGADGRKATAGWVFTAVVSALYSENSWPDLATAIANLRTGDPTGVFTLADQYAERNSSGQYTNMFDANSAISCADEKGVPNVAQIRTLQSQWRAKYPMFGAPLAVGMLTCALWPAKPDPYPTGKAVGAPPIVVVGTTGDPATPYAQTAKLANMLGTGVVLTWDGQGHTAYPQTPCVVNAVDNYLVNLRPPAAGTTCPAA